jgi:hypothetical protein
MVEAGERVGSIEKRWSFHGTAYSSVKFVSSKAMLTWLNTITDPDWSTSNRLSKAAWTISRAGSHA